MKISNRQLIDFIGVSNGMSDKKLPLKLSFALKRNRQLADDAIKPYNDEIKNVYETHKDDETTLIEVVDELLNEDVELDIKMVPVEIIEKTEEVGYDILTLGELEALSFMIEFEA